MRLWNFLVISLWNSFIHSPITDPQGFPVPMWVLVSPVCLSKNLWINNVSPPWYPQYFRLLAISYVLSHNTLSDAVLLGYSCEDLPSRTRSRLLLRIEEIRPKIWPEIPEYLKKTSLPNPVKSLGYIKCYSLNSPRPSNSIRYNCKKICSWSRRPKTILEIRKKATFL